MSLPAVHHDARARNQAGALGRQERHRIAHRLRPAELAQRQVARDEVVHDLRRVFVLKPLPAALLVRYGSGRYAVHQHAVLDQAQRRVLGRADERRLCRHIRQVAAVFPAVYGRDVDDAPPALRAHMRYHFAHQLKAAEQVQVKRRLELVQRQLGDVLPRARSARVVHEYVHGAKPVRDRLMQRGHRRRVRNIRHDAQRLCAESLQLCRRSVQRRLRPPAYGDIDALPRQRQRRVLPQPAAAARHQRHLACDA